MGGRSGPVDVGAASIGTIVPVLDGSGAASASVAGSAPSRGPRLPQAAAGAAERSSTATRRAFLGDMGESLAKPRRKAPTTARRRVFSGGDIFGRPLRESDAKGGPSSPFPG